MRNLILKIFASMEILADTHFIGAWLIAIGSELLCVKMEVLTPASICVQMYTICCDVINYSYLDGGIHDLVTVMYSYWICFSAICRAERQHSSTICQLRATFTHRVDAASSWIPNIPNVTVPRTKTC